MRQTGSSVKDKDVAVEHHILCWNIATKMMELFEMTQRGWTFGKLNRSPVTISAWPYTRRDVFCQEFFRRLLLEVRFSTE